MPDCRNFGSWSIAAKPGPRTPRGESSSDRKPFARAMAALVWDRVLLPHWHDDRARVDPRYARSGGEHRRRDSHLLARPVGDHAHARARASRAGFGAKSARQVTFAITGPSESYRSLR